MSFWKKSDQKVNEDCFLLHLPKRLAAVKHSVPFPVRLNIYIVLLNYLAFLTLENLKIIKFHFQALCEYANTNVNKAYAFGFREVLVIIVWPCCIG